MGALIDRVDGARETSGHGVWVDGVDYARARLLGGGAVPWGDTTACVAFFGQLDRLLRSDVQWLPVGAFFRARVAADGSLRTAMAARRRSGYALKTMLADGPARAALAELVSALARQSRAPVVLVLPDAAHWLAEAHALALGEPPASDPEAGERAAMYVADFLRTLADAGPGGLLVDAAGADGAGADPHGPLVNQARHYRWDCALLGGPAGWDDGIYDLCIDRDGARGARLDRLDVPPPPAAFYLQQVPADAEPEAVLERLAGLRGGGR
ncbi:MAG: hypothetical protein KDH20_05155 [Rhodocyclaceae bacterium]|nr:hypothetical protein [Rhodocyclaceae bacterium]